MTVSRRRAATCFALVVAAAACHARPSANDGDGGANVVTAAVRGAGACGASSACAARDYCAYEPGLCGRGKRPGACRPKPAECHDARAPVCGCDGKVYGNECEAHAAGVDLDVTGHCKELVPDWIACGARFCDARASYCEIVLSDVFELPTDYVCKPLPPACVPDGRVARKCDCFPSGTRCLSFCGDLETGGLAGFHLTCRL